MKAKEIIKFKKEFEELYETGSLEELQAEFARLFPSDGDISKLDEDTLTKIVVVKLVGINDAIGHLYKNGVFDKDGAVAFSASIIETLKEFVYEDCSYLDEYRFLESLEYAGKKDLITAITILNSGIVLLQSLEQGEDNE